MLRTVAFALVFALPALAAPVPKGVKKPAVPSLAGTRWEGVHTGADLGTIVYEFKEGGELAYAKRGGANRVNGTWEQEGDTLTWSVNNKYATYTCFYKDGAFEGRAVKPRGVTRNVKLTPAEKK